MTQDESTASRDRSAFGARLRSARLKAGLTQVDLAEAVGMSQSALAETETRALGSTLTVQLAKVLRVSPEWLATGDGSMEPALAFTPELQAALPMRPPRRSCT